MKEFMLYIRNHGDAKTALSETDHLAFVKQCEVYIRKLKAAKQLIAAQPISREGIVLRKAGEQWQKTDIDTAQQVQAGYYHIRAKDLGEAIDIAKENPEFNYVPSASIEIHSIKTAEEKTNFVYPT